MPIFLDKNKKNSYFDGLSFKIKIKSTMSLRFEAITKLTDEVEAAGA